MKDTFYFSHDYNSRNDTKLVEVMMTHGLVGIGAFWCIVEMLYEEGGYLPLKYERITFELRTDKNVVQSIINDFGLFENDGEKFWSNSIIDRLKQRQEKSEKAKQSIQKRWDKQKDTNVLRTKNESNTIKERKGKERKGKEIVLESVNTHSLEELMKQNIDIESFVLEYNSSKENILKELKAFYLYWSEKNQDGKKERWQKEKTFDVGRRFHKRMANSKKWDTGKKQNMVIVDF